MRVSNLGEAFRLDFEKETLADLTERESEPVQSPDVDADFEDPFALSIELRSAIAAGWRATYALLFDRPELPFVANLAPHHERAIRWHWNSRHRICKTQLWEQDTRKSFVRGPGISEAEFLEMVDEFVAKHQPRWLAYFPIFSRGHMKSTIAKRVAVVDALISMYYRQRGYCLYFSGSHDKVENHARSIEALLRRVRIHAPALATVKRSDEGGRSLGWKATFLNTAANYVFHFGSLQSGLAGSNLEDVRPTMMIPDDIDDRNDSPVTAATNFKLLTTEILPMGSKGTLVLWAQNLISRMSAMYRIYTKQARVLTNRMKAKPIPAIIGLVTEVRTVDGEVRDVIVAGEPTWKYFTINDCQAEINRFGLPAFLRECQHEVEDDRAGLMLKKYDDKVHPISVSEFVSVHGSIDVWIKWNKWIYEDWARTKTQYHASVAGYIAVASQNSRTPGFMYAFHPMSFPEGAAAEDVAERLLSVLSPGPLGAEHKTWADLRRENLLRQNATEHTQTVKEKLDFEHKVLANIIPQYSRPVLQHYNVLGGTMSHSEDTIRKLFRTCYGINLAPSNPKQFDAIDEIDRDLMVDYNTPHAFRPEQMGYSRFAIVVPDWKDCPPDQIRIDERTGRRIYPPKPAPEDLSPDALHDDQLLRYQLLRWRTAPAKLTETGEQIDAVLKLNDDFGQAWQMLWFKKLFANVGLDIEARVEAHMSKNLTQEALDAAPIEQKDNVLQARLQQQQQLKKDLTKPVQSAGIARLRKR